MAFVVKTTPTKDNPETLVVKQEPLTKVEVVEDKPKKCSNPDCYKHQYEGDLHKLYNSKSDYLMDIMFKD